MQKLDLAHDSVARQLHQQEPLCVQSIAELPLDATFAELLPLRFASVSEPGLLLRQELELIELRQSNETAEKRMKLMEEEMG